MEIRFRAERGFGQLLKETKETKQRRGVGHPKKEYSSQHDHSSPRKLKELGVTKDQSSQYQQMAAIPDDEFEVSRGCDCWDRSNEKAKNHQANVMV